LSKESCLRGQFFLALALALAAAFAFAFAFALALLPPAGEGLG
jgi:hypothetical protein